MSLAVIVARTVPGAHETSSRLMALGFTPIVSPMLTITETGFAAGDLASIRHLIFTSANGVRALRGQTVSKTLVAWCVGPSTTEAAREAGFDDIIDSAGDARDLARLLLLARPKGPLLHIANEAATGELVAALKAGGLDARFSAPYRTEPADLSAAARSALSGAGPVILLVHSAKAAAAIAAAQPPLLSAAIVAISAAALSPLQGKAARGEWVAGRPNEESLLDALCDAAASCLR